MADDFDLPPRPAKRRKTYASGRTILKSPQGQRALSSVSNALSSFSNRLLGRNKPQLEQVLHDDSAYGSKEDSLNEDEIVVAEEEVVTEGAPREQDENKTAVGRSTRRSSRKSEDVKEAPAQETAKAGKGDPVRQQKGGQSKTQASNKVEAKGATSEEPGNRRSSARRSLFAEAQSDRPQEEDDKTTDVRPSTSKKRKPNTRTVEADISDPVETENVEEADTTEAIDKPDENVDETVENQQRSSGRERRKPKRFFVEAATAHEPEPAPPEAQEIPLDSPAKPGSLVASPQPKGILTPSRRRREGPRKSVVFDESDKTIEERLGFKDIGSPSKKARKSLKEHAEIPETPQSAAEDEEDDLLLERNPPQDILQTLDLPSYSKDIARTDQSEDPPAVTAIKSLVLARLTSTSLPSSPPTHLSTQYSTLHSLMTSTLASGESNSLLLLGSRGSGKSMLINTALADLSSKHKDDFHIVTLNGFFQTDDRLALREIWRQLGREREALGEVDENDTMEVSGSYADTMASLLSLLSHPDEFDPDPNAMDLDPPTNQAKASKSIVIILDEFDLFTLHPRQTLLYNLFDIAQSKKAPIAVIGCSTRMDVMEYLEKRVKSRFSHRWVHVPSIKSVEGMKEAVEQILCVDEEDVVDSDMEERARWNQYIKSLFIPSAQVQALIQQYFYTTKSLPDLLAALYIPVATRSIPSSTSSNTASTTPPSTSKPAKSKAKGKPRTKPSTSASESATSTSIAPTITALSPIPSLAPPSVLTLLPHLPTLHLSLLIAAARLETIFALTHTNLNATYTHYLDLLARSKAHSHSTFASSSSVGIRQWSKETCLSAWEDLIRWEVLVPVSGEGVEWGTGGGREELSVRMVRVDVALEEVGWGVKEKFSGIGGDGEGVAGRGVGEVLGRWCREE